MMADDTLYWGKKLANTEILKDEIYSKTAAHGRDNRDLRKY